MDVLKSIRTRHTSQQSPAGAATVKNAAGGYTFAITDEQRLRRFLLLGSEQTYYTSARELTRQNADIVIAYAKTNPTLLVDTIVDVSVEGRAPKVNPAIFALAVAASEADEAGRAYALSKLDAVCRTGTHLFLFAEYVQQFRGWGPALRRAVANWYQTKTLDKLAYQVLKYRQRGGWTHRDLLALAHPKPHDQLRDNLYAHIVNNTVRSVPQRYVVFDDTRLHELPELVNAFIEAQAASSAKDWVRIIDANSALSWEMLPDAALNEPAVWRALLEQGLPQTALLRQLPRLTRLDLCGGETGKLIRAQLVDAEKLKRARVHPISVLVAESTYASGYSVRGSSSWEPDRKIVDALDEAFYAAYGAVEPSGARILLACDVSGSMQQPVSGVPLTCREAVAALTLVTLNVESDCEVIGFSDGTTHNSFAGYSSRGIASRLDITPRRRLDDVCRYMRELSFGATDCALPMLWAMQEKLDVDAIWCLTDNETWFGETMHPWQALREYRERYGATRFGVVSMTATGTSVADPNDAESIDISGFDTSVPQVISQFSANTL